MEEPIVSQNPIADVMYGSPFPLLHMLPPVGWRATFKLASSPPSPQLVCTAVW